MRTPPLVLFVIALAAACHEGETSEHTSPGAMHFPFGTPTGPEASALVGPDGGTLQSADGLVQLTIGPGALAEPTTIGIQAITNTAPGGSGTAYRLSPDGTTFDSPVQLTFSFDDDDLAGSDADVMTIGFQDDEGRWWAAAQNDVELDLDAQTISVATTHFSDWSRLFGLQLRPPTATLEENEEITLTAVDCQMEQVADDDLPSLLALCSIDEELPPLPGFIDEWAVDGHPGGTDATGRITPGSRPDQAVYKAPEFVVGVEHHTVSARIRRNGGDQLLVANITVTGSFTFELTGFYSAEKSPEACLFVASTVSDRVDVLLAPGDSGIYNIQDIDNSSTTIMLGALPAGDPGTLRLDAPPEHLDATDGSVVYDAATGTYSVSLSGKTTLGACTYTYEDVSIPIEAQTQDAGVDVAFAVGDLVDGSLVIAESADWSWTVRKIE